MLKVTIFLGHFWKHHRLLSQLRCTSTGRLEFPSRCKTCCYQSCDTAIIIGSPTEWEHLYAAMKEAEEIKNCIFKDRKTIIFFDLQLYIKAVMLQQRLDICKGFVFRMGELQIIFCALKVIGKLIQESGLDQAFDEACKWILSEKQDIRLMTSVTWFTYAFLKAWLKYDTRN